MMILCVALTNYHISFQPLCDEEDAAHCTCSKKVIGEKIATKRKMSQKYLEKVTNGSSIGSHNSS